MLIMNNQHITFGLLFCATLLSSACDKEHHRNATEDVAIYGSDQGEATTPVDSYPPDKVITQHTPTEVDTLISNIEGAPLEKISGEIRVLRPGQYHGEEIENGIENRKWYGIFYKNNHYFVQEARVHIELVNDALIDKGEEKSGKYVYVDSIVPVFLVSGLSNIKEGRLPTLQGHERLHSEQHDPYFIFPGAGYYCSFERDSFTYLINGYGAFLEEFRYFQEYNLTIERKFRKGNFTQKIQVFNWDRLDEKQAGICWIGDLDGDNKLDILLSTADNSSVSTLVLYLSSRAERNALFKAVAVFHTTGC